VAKCTAFDLQLTINVIVRKAGMDAYAGIVVFLWVAFRFFSELLFFACTKNK